jgi:CHASE3 domain sensor protein
MMNSFKSRPKQSHLEKEMNKQIVIIFALMILVCFFCAIYFVISYQETQYSHEYLDFEDANSKT